MTIFLSIRRTAVMIAAGLLFPTSLLVRSIQAATLTVNITADNENVDNNLSLREAIKIAAGSFGRPPTPGEALRISGLPNPIGSDDIVFESHIGEIDLGSQLPDVGKGDNINGDIG